MGNGWQIGEEESYVRSVAQCGGYEVVDRALAAVTYSLHRNPTGWPLVFPKASVYLAKTKLRLILPEVIPAYLLWFRLDEPNRYVWKLWVELASPEEMLTGDSFWDDGPD